MSLHAALRALGEPFAHATVLLAALLFWLLAAAVQSAFKVTTACLHGNERFLPRPGDSERLTSAARAAARDDSVAALSR